MRSPFYFIITPHNGKRYDNVKIYEDSSLITSTSTEDHRFSNRYAEVLSTPIGYDGDIQKGDTLLVHHNVFKFYYDMRFIEPIEEQDYYLTKFTNEEPLMGKIKYINEELLNLGLKVGDIIGYTPDSDYEFNVEGDKLYRMFTDNIAIKLNEYN